VAKGAVRKACSRGDVSPREGLSVESRKRPESSGEVDAGGLRRGGAAFVPAWNGLRNGNIYNYDNDGNDNWNDDSDNNDENINNNIDKNRNKNENKN